MSTRAASRKISTSIATLAAQDELGSDDEMGLDPDANMDVDCTLVDGEGGREEEGEDDDANQAAEAASGNPQQLMSRLRNFDSGALASVGVIAAEVIGFFTVGEMIGRFKIIGYRSEGGAAHH